MVDINLIRENPDKYKKSTADKQIDPSVIDLVLELDGKRRDLIKQVESLRSTRNKAAKEKNIEEGKRIKKELRNLEPELTEIEAEFTKILHQIPNPAADDVKIGKDDSENEVLRKVGKPKKFDFTPKDHVDLGLELGMFDIERAVKVSGSRFYYSKGDGVLLELAIVQYALETLLKEGFVPVIPPVIIKEEMMGGMGYLEHGGKEDMYVLDQDGMVLVGTSEQSIGPMHANEILDLNKGPKRYVGYSPCFRREAGTYGKDTRGILRVHQFNKVEMFSFTSQEESDKEHEFFRELEEKFLQGLGLAYQVIKQCTGDIGAPFYRKYDLEAWIPTQNKYRELTSTSNATDFQARGLNIKYQSDGEMKYAHMINGTAFAIGRTLIAIMENYQQKDGSIVIPEVLRKWMGKDIIKRI